MTDCVTRCSLLTTWGYPRDEVRMNREESAESLRVLAKLDVPDPRWEHFVVIDVERGGIRRFTLEDHFGRISSTKLRDHVTDDVWASFETARNASLYAWFVYRFFALAEQQALAALELALRTRALGPSSGSPAPGLMALLRRAIGDGAVGPDDFPLLDDTLREQSRWKGEPGASPSPRDSRFLADLQQLIPRLRNQHAHGHPILVPGYQTLALAGDIINQLFRPAERSSR